MCAIHAMHAIHVMYVTIARRAMHDMKIAMVMTAKMVMMCFWVENVGNLEKMSVVRQKSGSCLVW